ncbi:MAG: M48 family metalloprotease [Pyrinomonadaceae bacterium]|nr:M48 family metalloprotease [Pyrinomonadaceae bacterium]
MIQLENVLAEPILQAFGWALIHFIWQGTLIAGLLAGALIVLRKCSANARYVAATVTMLLMLAALVTTTGHLVFSVSHERNNEQSLAAAVKESRQSIPTTSKSGGSAQQRFHAVAELSSLASTASFRRWTVEKLTPLLHWLTMCWIGGVLILFARLCGGWVVAERLRRQGISGTVTAWQKPLARIAQRIDLSRSVQLCESLLVEVPTVIGWLRPIILVPPSALLGLTPQQFEALLAHELAHIKRHDYLVNLLQSIVETLLFYHPAVWWVSSHIRVEREHACDDMAVAATGDVLVYAYALTQLENLRGDLKSQLSLAANGGSVLTRIRRLIEPSSHQPRRFSPISTVCAVPMVLVTVLISSYTIHSEHNPELNHTASEQVAFATNKALTQARPLMPAVDQESHREVTSNIARDDTTGEDAKTRRIALSALDDHAGTVIVMNPRTGRVLTIINQEWALRRHWSPASVTKLITAVTALEEGVIKPNEQLIVSPKSRKLDLTSALAFSDNRYFRFVGDHTGFEPFIRKARQLGLGSPTGINHAGESGGYLPEQHSESNVGKMGAYGSGIEVTPMQLAVLASVIATGGSVPVPYVPRANERSPLIRPDRKPPDIPQGILRHISDGMVAAVNYGTAKLAYDPELKIAGKTGTTLIEGSSNTKVGMFTSYAPADDPRLVIVVLIEGRNESSSVAAGVAGRIYRALNN